MKKFEVGAMYWETSAVDHNDVMIIKITRRTEKSVWFVRMHGGKEDGEPSRTKIFADATREYVMPYKYSMAPVWTADRKAEDAAETTAPEADAVTPDEPETETATPDAPQKSATVAGKIEAAVSKYGTGMSRERLAGKVCRELAADGIEAVILNDRYIMAGGAEYQFIKRSGAWAVKEFAETDAATDAPANDETADDNKTAAMTAQEAAARKMIAEQTTEYLLKTWEGTTDNANPFIPTVRGWLMDELQARFPEAHDKWLDSETCEDAALREYIEAAEQGAAKTDSREEKKMTLARLFIETRMEFAKEEIDGVTVYTGGGEYCEPFGDVAEVLNRYGDREIEPIYLGGDEPASMTEPDAHGMIHVALVEAQEEAQDSAEAEADSAAAEFDNSEIGYAEIIRMLGADANAYFQKGDAAKAAEMKAGIRLNLEAAKRDGIVLDVKYDAGGRFADVRERTEAADDGAAAGQPAPQEDEAQDGAESVEAESETTADSADSAVSYYEIPHIANDRYIPVAAFRVGLTKDETRLFSRALAEYVCAVEIPDTRDGDYEIMRRFDCVRMLTRLTQGLFDAALDSVGGTVEFRFFPPIFQETESYVRWVMFHALNAVERLTKEAERHLKSATEAGFNDTAEFYRDRLAASNALEAKIRLAFERGFQEARAAAETTQESATEIIKAEPIGNGRVLRLVRDGVGYGIETAEPSGNGAFQVGWSMTLKRGLEKFAAHKAAYA